MKKQQQNQIISIDEFDETVSLYQLLPAGEGRALAHLKTIVNSILLNPEQEQRKPLSLLLVGKQGTRTHGRAFIRALGIEDVREAPAQLLQSPPNAAHDFFNDFVSFQSFLISGIDVLYTPVQKIFHEIITKGKYFGYNYQKRAREVVYVYNPVIMTARDISKIPDYFQESIEHIVMLEEYSERLELVVLQRLKYAQIDYEDEKVLNLLVVYGHNDLQNIIRLLKNSITSMLAGNRSVLTVGDINKARMLSIPRVGAPPMEDGDGIPF
jgi:hypothetical protein